MDRRKSGESHGLQLATYTSPVLHCYSWAAPGCCARCRSGRIRSIWIRHKMCVPKCFVLVLEAFACIMISNRRSQPQVRRRRRHRPIEGVCLRPELRGLYLDDRLARWQTHCCSPFVRKRSVAQGPPHSHATWLGRCIKCVEAGRSRAGHLSKKLAARCAQSELQAPWFAKAVRSAAK